MSLSNTLSLAYVILVLISLPQKLSWFWSYNRAVLYAVLDLVLVLQNYVLSLSCTFGVGFGFVVLDMILFLVLHTWS